MLLVLVLVLSSMSMGCCISGNDEADACRNGGDSDACLLLVDVCAEEAVIGGGDSSEGSDMLVVVNRDTSEGPSRLPCLDEEDSMAPFMSQADRYNRVA